MARRSSRPCLVQTIIQFEHIALHPINPTTSLAPTPPLPGSSTSFPVTPAYRSTPAVSPARTYSSHLYSPHSTSTPTCRIKHHHTSHAISLRRPTTSPPSRPRPTQCNPDDKTPFPPTTWCHRIQHPQAPHSSILSTHNPSQHPAQPSPSQSQPSTHTHKHDNTHKHNDTHRAPVPAHHSSQKNPGTTIPTTRVLVFHTLPAQHNQPAQDIAHSRLRQQRRRPRRSKRRSLLALE